MRISTLLSTVALLAGCSLVLDIEELAPSRHADGGSVGPHTSCERGDICDVANGQVLASEVTIAAGRPFWLSQRTVRTISDENSVTDLGLPADFLRAWGQYVFAIDIRSMQIRRLDGTNLSLGQTATMDPTLSEPLGVGPLGVFWSGFGGTIEWSSLDLQKNLPIVGASPAIALSATGRLLVWGAQDGSRPALFTADLNVTPPGSGQKWIDDDIEVIDALVSDSEHVAWLDAGGEVRVERFDGGFVREPFGVIGARSLALGQIAGESRLVFINHEGEVRSIRLDGNGEVLHASQQNPDSSLAVGNGVIVWASARDGYIRSLEP